MNLEQLKKAKKMMDDTAVQPWGKIIWLNGDSTFFYADKDGKLHEFPEIDEQLIEEFKNGRNQQTTT